jgi:hypothetical protein
VLVFLDYFCLVFHTLLILFNLFGWAWRRVRRLHFVSLALTLGSWLGLGMWYGIGYCPLTDWHWQIREARGDTDLPFSYLKFLVDELTGLDVNARLLDTTAVVLLAVVVPLSVALNIRDFRSRRTRRIGSS